MGYGGFQKLGGPSLVVLIIRAISRPLFFGLSHMAPMLWFVFGPSGTLSSSAARMGLAVVRHTAVMPPADGHGVGRSSRGR